MTDTGIAPANPRSWWSAAGRLAALVVAVIAVVELTAQATRQRITRNEAAQVTKIIAKVLPAEHYDNEPDRDRILVVAPELLGSNDPLPLYRARRNGEPSAAVMTVVARQGYVGPIRLLVSLTADGTVLAVRAIAHEETPGLGDRIDAAKSDWIKHFNGRSVADPSTERWAVRRDGGDFDQLTGATITSRAVVNAVRDAGLYFRQHRTEIFERPAE